MNDIFTDYLNAVGMDNDANVAETYKQESLDTIQKSKCQADTTTVKNGSNAVFSKVAKDEPLTGFFVAVDGELRHIETIGSVMVYEYVNGKYKLIAKETKKGIKLNGELNDNTNK